MLGKRLADRSGYRQRQLVDGELLAPAWRKTVINRRMAAVLYSTAECVWLCSDRIVSPFEISVGKSNLFDNWQ